MTKIPHLALPIRVENGRAVVVEQNSLDDVANCIETVLRYRKGDRPAVPDFGITDPAFPEGDVDIDTIRREVERWEERAGVLIEQEPDRFDELVRYVRVQVTGGTDDG